MSGHLIGCVKKLGLTGSHKLAMVAFADSADDRTHIGFPGYEGVMEWAQISRSQAAQVIKDLVGMGYLQPHKRGRRGQRAEYVVFPAGCCDLHRTPEEEPELDLEQLAAAAGVTLEQARILLGQTIVVPPTGDDHDPQQKGSGSPDANALTGSGSPDPNEPSYTPDPAEPVENTEKGSGTPDAIVGKGPERVHDSGVNPDAFTTSKTNSPLPPPASRQGRSGTTTSSTTGASCDSHPNGHGNCRACGTTPRQRAAAAKRLADLDAAEDRRMTQLAERQARAIADAERNPEASAKAKAEIRAALEDSRRRRQEKSA